MPDLGETIILRFRDLVTETNGTITRHIDIINKYGYVWWAWWKKGSEKLPIGKFSVLKTLAQSSGGIAIFLVDSGQSLLYKATCTEVQLHPEISIFSPNPEKTPEYYRNQKYWAWFKFTKIEECSETQLKQYSYVDFPELFNDANIDYSKFNNKIVYSIPELTQQNRTVWFIRQSKSTDSDNEIVLLNSEYIQPTHFSRRYW